MRGQFSEARGWGFCRRRWWPVARMAHLIDVLVHARRAEQWSGSAREPMDPVKANFPDATLVCSEAPGRPRANAGDGCPAWLVALSHNGM